MARSKSKLEKIASRKGIIKISPLRDARNRRYVPFCDYGWHQGILQDPTICEERNCVHYYKFYLERKLGRDS